MCRDEVICDLAETYHIYDYRRVPVRLLGTLVSGLGSESRTVRKCTGVTVPPDTVLLARIYDSVQTLIWFFSKDGSKNRNRPEPITDTFFVERKPKETTAMSIEDFERKRAQILKGVSGNVD